MTRTTLRNLIALGLATASAATAHADLKIGFTAPMSGPVAAVGQDQYDGFMLGIESLASWRL